METSNKNNEINIIELRSEKVRNIIGNIPPLLIRSGTSILFFIFCGIITGSIFFKYSPTYKVKATITPLDSAIMCEIQIPFDLRNKVNAGDAVILSFDDIPHISSSEIISSINNISSNLTVEASGGYYRATIQTPCSFASCVILGENKIEIKEIITINATVFGKKQSYFRFAIEPLVSFF